MSCFPRVCQVLEGNKRWAPLIIVAGLNFLNAALWISYASVNNIAASYFHVSNDAINWLSMVYFVTTIPLTLLSTILIEKYGVNVGIQIGAVFNMLGAALRMASTYDAFPENRFAVTMVGQVFAAVAQPFLLIIPTKVSETWFADSHRTCATMVTAMANPLGVAVSSLLSPQIVSKESDMHSLDVVWGVPSCVFGIVSLLCFRVLSSPRALDVADDGNDRLSYLQQVKQLFTNKPYIILFISVGGGVGFVSCISTMLQQILCPKGYSNEYAGLCGGLLTGAGIIGAGISSIIVDKTHKFQEVAKVSFALATLSFIGFAETLNFSKDVYAVILIAAFGLFVFAAYPVCLELSVECTHPIDEALSTGFIIVAGQIMGMLFIFFMSALGRPLSAKDKLVQTCTLESYDNIDPLNMNNSVLALAGLCALAASFFITFFNTPYRRSDCNHVS